MLKDIYIYKRNQYLKRKVTRTTATGDDRSRDRENEHLELSRSFAITGFPGPLVLLLQIIMIYKEITANIHFQCQHLLKTHHQRAPRQSRGFESSFCIIATRKIKRRVLMKF